MKTQSAKQNESNIRRVFSLILPLLMLSAILSCAAQKQPAETPKVFDAWEITSSDVSGRFRQDDSFYQIKSNGQASFRGHITSPTTRERKDIRTSGKISSEAIAELEDLIKKLNLPKAKAIQRKCVESLHGPSFNFTVKIADQSYTVDSCENTRQFGSTLISSQEQNETFRQLRENARTYVNQIKKDKAKTDEPPTPAEIKMVESNVKKNLRG